MKIATVALAALVLCAGSARAQVTVFGLGVISCASWLVNPEPTSAASQWMFGFWAAANDYSNQDVAGNSDAQGILAEIEITCRASPSKTIRDATADTWKKLAGQSH